VLMRTIHGRVHGHFPLDQLSHIGLGQQLGEDVVPGAVTAEPAVPLPHCLPRTSADTTRRGPSKSATLTGRKSTNTRPENRLKVNSTRTRGRKPLNITSVIQRGNAPSSEQRSSQTESLSG
jgi:hypothetical protein